MTHDPQSRERPEQARARLEAEGRLGDDERGALWQRIEQSAEGPRAGAPRRARAAAWAPALALGTVAAIAAVVALWPAPAAAPGAGDGQHAAAPQDPCALDPDAPELQRPAHCGTGVVQVAGDRWELEGGADVERVADGARVRRGAVRFRVVKRHGGERFRVHVSHGRVEVIGTVFRVEQRDGRGSVHVSEGVIEFVWADGSRERVAAGQTLRWPREAPPEAPQDAEEPAHDSREETQPQQAREERQPQQARADMDAVIGRLLQLRSQRRHGEAVALLRETLEARGLSPMQRGRISYELGLSLEAAGQPACAHWRRHARRFEAGPHAGALAERLQRCEAEPTGAR